MDESVYFNVYGDDMDELRRKAEEGLAELLGQNHGWHVELDVRPHLVTYAGEVRLWEGAVSATRIRN